MSYNITISRISNDFKTAISASKNEWEECAIPNELKFIEKNTYPQYYLEVTNVDSKDFIPCFWISKDFQTASIDSSVFLTNNELEKYLLHIASKIGGIVFGEEGELYFIPHFGKIEPKKRLIEQEIVTINELKENNLTLDDQTLMRKYINIKLEKASS